MGQKMPLQAKAGSDGSWDNRSDSRPPASAGDDARRLVTRIAGALQVQPDVLYAPDAANARTHSAKDGADLDQQCEALLHAYRRIRDPEERRRLLLLVQDASEETEALIGRSSAS
ncbi:hypothetical protein [Methylobacterium sp. B1]|uniref:hypothetical protein n=1 Tax=Methylobacterium sp. B1 TaxID=91459 RepID=UPI0016518F39|nr:hypothetical protein [Methylobacterium sp. B1]